MLATDKGNGELMQADILHAFELVLESISDSLTKGEKITIANCIGLAFEFSFEKQFHP